MAEKCFICRQNPGLVDTLLYVEMYARMRKQRDFGFGELLRSMYGHGMLCQSCINEDRALRTYGTVVVRDGLFKIVSGCGGILCVVAKCWLCGETSTEFDKRNHPICDTCKRRDEITIIDFSDTKECQSYKADTKEDPIEWRAVIATEEIEEATSDLNKSEQDDISWRAQIAIDDD